jgi:hypothetical protein
MLLVDRRASKLERLKREMFAIQIIYMRHFECGDDDYYYV